MNERVEHSTALPWAPDGQEGWPFTAVILLSAATVLHEPVAEDNFYCFVITADGNELHLPELYNVLQQRPAIRFTFCFAGGTMLQVQLSQLIPFFFLPGSIQCQGRPWVGVSGLSDSSATMALAGEELRKHGFDGLDYVVIQRERSEGEALVFESVGSFRSGMPAVLNERAVKRQVIFIKADDAATVRSATLSIAEIANRFRYDFPLEANLRTELDHAAKKIPALEKCNVLLENELQNFREYNRILQAGHPDNEIQRFYDREYEVLPRWYKKFGHIIKWLMGNRKKNVGAGINNKGVQP